MSISDIEEKETSAGNASKPTHHLKNISEISDGYTYGVPKVHRLPKAD